MKYKYISLIKWVTEVIRIKKGTMKMEFVIGIDPNEHDAFVKQHSLSNLLQSSNWAKVKDNWDHKIVGVKENGEIVASASVLIKRLPFSFSILYTPRGPVMDFHNTAVVECYFQGLKHFARTQHAIYLTMDPAIHCNDYLLSEANEQRYAYCDTIIDILKQNGACFKGYSKSLEDTIQPRYHANVYACDNFRDSLPKSARKALNIAEKKMLKAEACGAEAVHEFAQVMHHTEARKQIALRDEAYFEKLMQIYGEDAIIYLIRIPLKELYEDASAKLADNEKALAECPENAKKKRFTLTEQHVSYEREVTELKQHIEQCGDSTVGAGALCVKFGKDSELLYAGMDDTYKRYMAPYLAFYQCMEWSFEHGCTSCNMGGIEGNLQGGLTKFKANFHPIVNEYLGEFDIPYRKIMYRIVMKLLARRKKQKS